MILPERLNNSWWCFSSSSSTFEDRRRFFSRSCFILFFSGGTNSSFVDHIFLLVSNTLSCRCPSYSFTSRYSFVPDCLRYLKDSCFHSAFLQTLSRMLSQSSHLIQPVESLFSSNHFNGVSFEWALTHRSFSRILPDSSNFTGVILKFI